MIFCENIGSIRTAFRVIRCIGVAAVNLERIDPPGSECGGILRIIGPTISGKSLVIVQSQKQPTCCSWPWLPGYPAQVPTAAYHGREGPQVASGTIVSYAGSRPRHVFVIHSPSAVYIPNVRPTRMCMQSIFLHVNLASSLAWLTALVHIIAELADMRKANRVPLKSTRCCVTSRPAIILCNKSVASIAITT